MTAVIDDALAGKNLAPARQYIDSGYLSADLAVAELARHGIALIGPMLADTSPQAQAATATPARISPSTTTARKSPARRARPRPRGTRAPSAARTRSSCSSPRQLRVLPRPDPVHQGQRPPAHAAAPRPRRSRVPPPAPRRKRSRSRLTTPAAPAWRAPCTRPSLTEHGEHATEGCRKHASTTCTWPSPSTCCGLKAYWNGTPLDRRRTSHLARLELSLAA